MITILVIDDEEGILELLKEELLDELGESACIETCLTLTQAEEYLAEHTPDYIISDYQSLNTDLRHLALLGIPIVFYTGRITDLPSDIKELVVLKPARIQTILALLLREAG